MSHVATPIANNEPARARFSDWSQEEDDILLWACAQVRTDANHHSWEKVSRLVKNAHNKIWTAKQCRARYQKARTDPVQKRTTPQGRTWSAADNAALKELCERHQSATSNHMPWKTIAEELNGRGIEKTAAEARHRWGRMKKGAARRGRARAFGEHTCKVCNTARGPHLPRRARRGAGGRGDALGGVRGRAQWRAGGRRGRARRGRGRARRGRHERVGTRRGRE